MASEWAQASYAKKLKVGCLVVKDRIIIADGYNGTPEGFPNICEDLHGKTFPYVLHAEANAITKLSRSSISSEGATVYITHAPCVECAKLMIQAKIKRVVFGQEYKRQDGINLLKWALIHVDLLPLDKEII